MVKNMKILYFLNDQYKHLNIEANIHFILSFKQLISLKIQQRSSVTVWKPENNTFLSIHCYTCLNVSVV